MSKRYLVMLLVMTFAPALIAQALPTASRVADAQIGAGFSLGSSDYSPETLYGLVVYADLDVRPHLGAEFDFHQIGTSASGGSRQRTYELGARYLRTYGPMRPYVRAMYGRGEFSYPYGLSDLFYNVFSGAVGADYKLGTYVCLRIDYEYQNWLEFHPSGLHPQLVTFGVTYHLADKQHHR